MTTLRKAIWLVCVIAAVGVEGAALLGQNSGPATLNVYVNTVQIPVLVLGKNRQPVGPIPTNRFSVSFDSGPWFSVTHARLEGDDPISLAILLDVSGNSMRLIGNVSDEIAGLAPNWLHPRDHVSVYSLDCDLMRSAHDLPAETASLKQAVDSALAAWRSRTSINSTVTVPPPPQTYGNGCQQTIHLWDALVAATNQLRELPGRRVILVLTDGDDEGSRYTWKELLTDFAQTNGVAVFAVRTYAAARRVPKRSAGFLPPEYDPLVAVCESSGGMVFTADDPSLGKTLQRFTSILRQRYIVEFPRPYNASSGIHDMEVKIHKGAHYFIRPAGISVPLANPALARDPATVPPDSAHEPEMGTRKVLTPN
jgi:VWFA-related protein